jgi:hypothetical protein
VVCDGPAICYFQDGQLARPEHREDVEHQVWRLVQDWSDYFRAIAWRPA